jgi:hypothetical protein
VYHTEWMYMDDEGMGWLDLDSDGEPEAVLSLDVPVGQRWGQGTDTGWGYDDAE